MTAKGGEVTGLIRAGLDARVATALMDLNGGVIGPTALGLGLGLPYVSASSKMMAPLRRLIKAGKAEMVKPGKYRWRYDH